MYRVFRKLFARQPKSKNSKPRLDRAALRLVPLEDRSLLSTTTLDALIGQFNTGVGAALNNSVVSSVVNTLSADLPLIQENLSQLTGISTQFQQAFNKTLTKANLPDTQQILADLKTQLTNAGMQVDHLDVNSDANGNFALIRYQKDIPLTLAFSRDGSTGFSYFDDFVNGKLSGSINVANSTLRVNVAYGVDDKGFFLSDSTAVDSKNQSKVTLDPITVSGAVSGDLAIRSLANVHAHGQVGGTLAGNLSVTDNDAVQDHKVRIAGLASSLGGNVNGNLFLNFDGSKDSKGEAFTITANFPFIDKVEIQGKLAATLNNGSLSVSDTLASKTSATDLIRGVANKVFAVFGGNNLPVLGNSTAGDSTNLKSLLSTKIPLTDKSVLGLVGLEDELGFLLNGDSKSFGATDTLTSIKNSLSTLGIELLPGKNVSEADAVIRQLIRGEKVDLIRFRKEGSFKIDKDVTLLKFVTPIIPPITAEVDVGLNAKLFAGYKVGLGFDTTGFYLDPDTSVNVGGSIKVTGSATVGVLGVGLTLEAGVGVSAEAGVKFYDPDPTDGKIYYDEIFNSDPTKSTLDNFLNSMTFYANAQVEGDVKLFLDLPILPDVTFFEKHFKGDTLFSTASDKRVTTPDGKNTFRKIALVPTNKLDLSPFVQVQPDGKTFLVLDHTASASAANVRLAGKPGGLVDVTVFGQGSATTSKRIDKVIFRGSTKDDRLDVDSLFTIPVDADGGLGNDQLTGGAGNDTLAGGAGHDVIVGGAGSDVITGGTGRNLLRGGLGNDSLTAGGEGDLVNGEEGNDTLTGGAGVDVLKGGANDDRITGGGGDQLHGEAGNDTLLAIAGTTTPIFFDGGLGNDAITAGGGDDVLVGGDGSDTLHGGGGHDLLDGGTGTDSLFGGDGHDVMRGGDQNDTLFGGNGNDRLSGGKGADVLFGDDQAQLGGESGRDRFEIDFANDFGSAIDTMHGGPDRDTLAIVGQAVLVQQLNADGSPKTDAAGNPVLDETESHSNDDFVISAAADGTITASYRPLGSTAAYQQIKFNLVKGPDLNDIDDVIVEAAAGNDRVELGLTLAVPIKVNGGAGNDTLLGSNAPDTFYGGEGNDTIDGRGGADTLFGDGDANQVIVPDALGGKDTILGGGGQDAIFGGGNDDRLDGGTGKDTVNGQAGTDTLIGGNDAGDVLNGDADADYIVGGQANEEIHGGGGNDTILGGDGPDQIFGDENDDMLVGEFGRDMIFGGAGNDTLKAFIDNDVRAAVQAATGISLPALSKPTQAQDAARMTALVNEENGILANTQYQQLLAIPVGQRTVAQTEALAVFDNRLTVIQSLKQDLNRTNTVVIDTLNGDADNDSLFGSPYVDSYNGNAGSDSFELSDLNENGFDSFNGGDTLGDNDALVIHGTNVDDLITLTYAANGNVTVFGNGTKLGVFGFNNTDVAFTGFESLRIKSGQGNDRVDLSGLRQRVPFVGQIEVFGEDGDDTIDASTYEGKTVLDGGTGNDTIRGGIIADQISGGAGNDSIAAGNGDNRIDGGDGLDTITAGVGNDTVSGGNDADRIDVGNGFNNVTGGDGNDTITAGDGNDTLFGGNGDDLINGGDGNNRLAGDTPFQTIPIPGSSFGLVILASGNGNDVLIGGSGIDTIDGGDGNDTGYAGAGNDAVTGGAGNDVLLGMAGNDNLNGGDGHDQISGDGRTVVVNGVITGFVLNENALGDGNDTLVGGQGGDTLFGNGGNDLLDNSASSGSDQFLDRLDGGAGTDTAKISFRRNQTFINFETVQGSVFGLQSGVVWANGQQVATGVTDFLVNPRGDIIVLNGSKQLRKFAKTTNGFSSTSTQLAINVDELVSVNASNVVTYARFNHFGDMITFTVQS